MQMDTLMAGLEGKEYETKTRGTRRVEAARALGEGAPPLSDLHAMRNLSNFLIYLFSVFLS